MIDPREALASGLSSLRHHALRSFLAMLGIIFGVGAVIAMLSIGAGAERQALEIIDAMGLRNVVVKDKRIDRENELSEIRRKSAGLSTRDAQAIRDAVPGVERVVAKIEVEAWKVLSTAGRAKPRVLGVSSDYPQLVKLSLHEGRFFDRTDEDTHGAVCVIGDRVRRDLFGFEPALGRPLKVNDQWLTVVGVLEGGGGKREIQGVTLEGTANDIYLPVTAAERRFGRGALKAPLDELVVSMAAGTPVQESAAVISTLLDRLHGGAADYTITVPEALLEQSRRTQRLFDIVMGAIAGISLLVGGIGIMNIMLATVLERTREIGVRRAMGARQVDIRNQFVMEAFTVTVIGGLLGIAMGSAIAKGVAAYAGWKTIVTLGSIVLSVGVSAGVGLVFGSYPRDARRPPRPGGSAAVRVAPLIPKDFRLPGRDAGLRTRPDPPVVETSSRPPGAGLGGSRPFCSRRALSHRLVGWCGDQLSGRMTETSPRVPLYRLVEQHLEEFLRVYESASSSTRA